MTAKPYLGRALTDDEFRDNLRAAFAAARAIYEELGGQRTLASAASQAATNEDVHANLRRAITELRQAADRLQREERQARSHRFRTAALVFGGVLIGIFFNPFTGPTTRRWITGRGGGETAPLDPGSPNGSSG